MLESPPLRAGLLAGALSIAGCGAAPPPDPGLALAGLADELRGEFALPGLIIGFHQGDHPAHLLASGWSRTPGGEPLTGKERMHLGSVSKPVAATLIADLVADGYLDWGSRLSALFPELASTAHPAYRKLTVWDVLTHEARFPAFEEDEEIARAPVFSGTPREVRSAFLAWLVTQAPQPSDDDDPYSNAGYSVLASVAERATGEDFEPLVKQRVFDRLGLKAAGFGWPALVDPRAPWGHRFRDGAFEPHPPDDGYQLGPTFAAAGDMHLSVPDLMRFGETHLAALTGRDGGYDPAAIRRLHQTESGYAGGWYVRPTGHYHTGSADTFFALIVVSPARRTVIAMAANGSNPERDFALAGKLMGRIYRAYGVMDISDDGVPVDR